MSGIDWRDMLSHARRPLIIFGLLLLAACSEAPPTTALPPAPAGLDQRVAAYKEAAAKHPQHPWRDIAPLNADGTANGYIEISRGESTKWEFRIPLNTREVDRMIPPELGGYPVNYGFLPQTVSYDGDPADILVLGPPIEGGTVVKGRILALMMMIDTGDIDSKVVVTRLDADGRPMHPLTEEDKRRMTQFFDTYKKHEGKVTRVTGWADRHTARQFLEHTHGFFATVR
jgi:inorganic pyrophosphatase